HSNANFRRNIRQERKRVLDHCLQISFPRLDLLSFSYLRLRQNLNASSQVWIFLLPLENFYSLCTLRNDPHRVTKAFHALDHHERSDLVKILRAGVSFGGVIRPNGNATK